MGMQDFSLVHEEVHALGVLEFLGYGIINFRYCWAPILLFPRIRVLAFPSIHLTTNFLPSLTHKKMLACSLDF